MSRPLEAVEAFDRAHALRPGAVLRAWKAEALFQGGKVEEAIDLAVTVLQEGGPPELAVSLSIWLATEERYAEAAATLRVALNADVLEPREVRLDKRFEPFLDEPAFAFLPADGLEVRVDSPTEPSFWGSEVTVELDVLGTVDGLLSVSADHVEGPVRLVRVQEDAFESTVGSGRQLRYVFKVTGAGNVSIGPLTIVSGPYRSTVDPIRFDAEAPPGKQSRAIPFDLRAPSARLEGIELPSVVSRGSTRCAAFGPAQTLRTGPALVEVSRHEWLRGGHLRSSLRCFEGEGALSVLEGREVVAKSDAP